MLKIFAVSDATGQTAERVVRAALAQFEKAPVTIVRLRNIRSPARICRIVEEAAGEKSLIIHSLVSDKLRRLMLEQSRARAVDSLDMLGPVLERLATHLELSPSEKPGLLRQLVDARSREIEAVDFAFRHDDGHNAHDLDRAEVVLVGVSRTMKTPTMLYLAYRGWFAANVPLVPDVEPFAALVPLDPARVFHLHMAPERLVELRRVRARNESIPVEFYATLQHVHRELEQARQTCLKHRWRTIDVTGKSVEEAGREIIALLPRPALGATPEL